MFAGHAKLGDPLAVVAAAEPPEIVTDGELLAGLDDITAARALDDDEAVAEEMGPVYGGLLGSPVVVAPMPSGIVFEDTTGETLESLVEYEAVVVTPAGIW